MLHGDALSLMPMFSSATFDAVITDPPYSSGGMSSSARAKSTAEKYTSSKRNNPLPSFDGDARDQRSWTFWTTQWLTEARRVTKPGGVACVFIDWRQYAALSDAFQAAGWIWRGVAVWDKMSSRPQPGRFRQQTEFIIWGSNGDLPVSRPVPCLPGVFTYANESRRWHQTVKPLQLMRDVARICVPGGVILDPFAGSGTTVLAACMDGYDAVGIEVNEEYVGIANERLAAISPPVSDTDRASKRDKTSVDNVITAPLAT
jgi:site-specific DNA-methyltransferase (adenine-specific)